MSEIKLLQLNIEGSRHLARILPFIQQEQPEILCIQEIWEKDIPLIANVLPHSFHHIFAPMLRIPDAAEPRVEGSAIFSQLPFTECKNLYYTDEANALKDFDGSTLISKHETQAYAVTVASIEKEGIPYRIATTHFTWTPNGEADDLQRADLEKMFAILEPLEEFVLTGDFNAPRGKEIFSRLAERFTDNVPPHYTTSIDRDLHRAGALQVMVDGIFSTPSYHVSDVEMVCGLSDHCALRAKITRSQIR